WIWRIAIGSGVTFAVALLAIAGLWWRLSNGPIELDMATPWLKKAMEENFGGNHSVSVGGTQIERDENGRPTLRLRDIVVRDVDGTVVASAPKAEVGLSGGSLFSGRLVAESLNLVGAELSIRIEKDGRVTVFTGADKRPIATAQAPVAPPAGTGKSSGASAGGGFVVEDQRDGKRWTFDRINASLMRPAQGGIMFKLESDSKSQPWFINAAMRPLEGGLRAVGMPRRVNGEILAETGDIVDRLDPNFGMHIDRADVRFSWDVTRGMLLVPFQVQASGNQFTMRAIAEAPTGNSTAWTVSMQRDDPVIDPIILGPPAGSDEETLALNRANLKLRIDPVKRRIDLDQADVRRIDTRATHNFGVAFSGSLDMSSDKQRLAFGVAGNRMPTWALKRLWPAF